MHSIKKKVFWFSYSRAEPFILNDFLAKCSHDNATVYYNNLIIFSYSCVAFWPESAANTSWYILQIRLMKLSSYFPPTCRGSWSAAYMPLGNFYGAVGAAESCFPANMLLTGLALFFFHFPQPVNCWKTWWVGLFLLFESHDIYELEFVCFSNRLQNCYCQAEIGSRPRALKQLEVMLVSFVVTG